jgi:hypothetical protein
MACANPVIASPLTSATTTTSGGTAPAATIAPNAQQTATSTCSCGNLFQGSALPAVTTTQESQTTVPQFYTDYLQNIANLGQNAVMQGGVAGASPLQQQAYQMAPCAAFAGANTLGAASTLQGLAGATTAPDVVQNYMNPYTQDVVNEMARLQQQNLQQNVLPSLGAAGVSSGNFGSQRQQQALGQTLANMQANLTGQQEGALSTGYQNAITNAQTDLSRALQAGTGLASTGTQQNALTQAGLNQLSTLGGQQQTLAQNELNYPMTQTQNYAKLLSGYAIPTGTTQQTVAPGQQGEFTNSPLSQIAGLASLVASLYGTPASNAQGSLYNAQAGAYSNQAMQTAANLAGMTMNPDGTFTNKNNPGVNYNYNSATGTFTAA